MLRMGDVFCQAVRGENPVDKMYEDGLVMAFLDKYPKGEGHALVIPKKHAENIYDIEEETLAQCHRIAKRVAIAMKKILKMDGVLIMQANEAAGLQHVFHFHVHIIPKYANNRTNGKSSRELLEKIIEKLR